MYTHTNTHRSTHIHTYIHTQTCNRHNIVDQCFDLHVQAVSSLHVDRSRATTKAEVVTLSTVNTKRLFNSKNQSRGQSAVRGSTHAQSALFTSLLLLSFSLCVIIRASSCHISKHVSLNFYLRHTATASKVFCIIQHMCLYVQQMSRLL